MRREERAQDPLRPVQVSLGEHPRCGEHRRRQPRKHRHLPGRRGRLLRAAGGTVQLRERPPARVQDRIECHGALIGGNRGTSVPAGAVAVAALLIQAGEVSMSGLQALEGRECGANAPELALADRNDVEHVAVLRRLLKQGAGEGQRLGVRMPVDQSADSAHLGLDPCFGFLRLRCHSPLRWAPTVLQVPMRSCRSRLRCRAKYPGAVTCVRFPTSALSSTSA